MTDQGISKKFPNSLIELFKQELSIQSDKFLEEVQKLVENAQNDALLTKMLIICKEIKGGAKIAHITFLVTLSLKLENYFDRLLLKNASVPIASYALLTQIGHFIKNLAQLDLEKFNRQVEETLLENQQLLTKLAELEESVEKPLDLPEEGPFFIDSSTLELFCTELENQVEVLSRNLIDFEHTRHNSAILEAMMRAAHSIKGAARVIKLEEIVQLAHAIEDCFVATQKKTIDLSAPTIDTLLKGVDFLAKLIKITPYEMKKWLKTNKKVIAELIVLLELISTNKEQVAAIESIKSDEIEDRPLKKQLPVSDRVLRVTAQNLNRLMGLAGESLVESRWVDPFTRALMKVKKNSHALSHYLDSLREVLNEKNSDERLEHYVAGMQQINLEINHNINERLRELELFSVRHASLSDRLYYEVIASRMRPFADGISGFPRMIRDISRQLGKSVKFEVIGKNTPVDRDILEKLEAPLGHLIRNAIDHGIETTTERVKLGKPPEGIICLEAQHKAGMLAITVSDDGAGLDSDKLRAKIIERHLVSPQIAANLSENELVDFLFLPGFSTSTAVTDISGRGMGLNIVQSMLQEVAGTTKVTFQPGKGIAFHLLLPLTLSVIRGLLVSISNESYAFPLARIERALIVLNQDIILVENHQYFNFEGENIGLIKAAQVLDLKEEKREGASLAVIILSDQTNFYGIVVDQFMGEKELVVQELDKRLSKVPNIHAVSLLEDGSPILIVDVEDIIRSIDTLLTKGSIHHLAKQEKQKTAKKKRILVVDDSITVREVECRLLLNRGFDVQSATNGIDGWNALSLSTYDLVITDIDMPRMNGIELVKRIRNEPRLKNLPIMIVSYKERKEDRLAGLEAGANYYLSKSNFHDEALINATIDLIGEA